MEKVTLNLSDIEDGDYSPLLEAADRAADGVQEGETRTVTIELTITNTQPEENEGDE